jgi:hypothetical protein
MRKCPCEYIFEDDAVSANQMVFCPRCKKSDYYYNLPKVADDIMTGADRYLKTKGVGKND